ncbi:hypothetical protein D3C78_1051610 [compost metagenome]
MTRITGLCTRNRDFCLLAEDSLLKFHSHRILQIIASLRRIRITPASAASKEHVKNIAKAAAEVSASATHPLIRINMTVSVVG